MDYSKYDLKKSEVEPKLKEGVKVLSFYQIGCPPCDMIKPELVKLVEKNKDKMELFLVRINRDGKHDEERRWAAESGVSATPTTFIYKDGKIVNTIVGYKPLSVLEEEMSKLEMNCACSETGCATK
ncbi:THIOREDOXIN [Mycoplasmopsis pulmonis]|uniref:THIOREDOXIN n=1 Tax=Mycoplasmopsis pulmonis (strain UAB CTIP) TaxID=272635 RepID=Q98R26_MYCPU|nr:thioredoxin family protein [Mycoplasmopsis pulmonis]MDZ7293151.1 thioredoxin family protein [Mycoplasmopsis pulmonis]CAC13357.1 THIOREDOXIN [Mycoplasmopsis pulmonis]VEU67948.1 Thioredoxin [Mycoplasmopsis pulmonis]